MREIGYGLNGSGLNGLEQDECSKGSGLNVGEIAKIMQLSKMIGIEMDDYMDGSQ